MRLGKPGQGVLQRLFGQADLRALALDRVADRTGEQIDVGAALGQEVLSPLLHRGDPERRIIGPGEHDHRHVGRGGLDGLERLELVGIGKREVEQHDVGRLLEQAVARVGQDAAVDDRDLIAHPLGQHLGHERGVGLAVLDDEDLEGIAAGDRGPPPEPSRR